MNTMSIDKKKALELIMDDSTVVIDVRTEEELEEVPPIVEDCWNIPFDDEFLEFVKSQEEIKKDSTILVYCAHGVRSLKAAILLRAEGYENTYDLAGGIEAIFNTEEVY